ncbi:glycosyltransferase family 4 protein [Luteolibacter flavescens]|uniref:Glycosyltransferase family 4 protein n=1 Tax=Luteolibacter flavescens TaxID=1859460 RepID=A0ABT3FUR2_9BACT|nr:glycosyltransferase family 4 protein [Luteolibacter flavescens]MCW1887330.1 glycosyltransferase family 4 protein [Luteolibacter flavescens]
MHFVLLNQYYPADEAPTGLMLEAVAESLLAEGHRVTVLCAAGGYAGDAGAPESAPENGTARSDARQVQVVRIGATKFGRGTFVGKLADYASYYLGVAWKLLTLDPKPDRVVALTTPPYLSVLARLVTKFRGADHAHWVMDLYPDVMVAHGMLREGSLQHRILSAFARFGFGGKRCATVITLGPDMAERVGRHMDAGKTVEWVPLWGTGESSNEEAGEVPKSIGELEAEGRALRRERGWADDEVVLMYSGNMGLGHRFGEFLAAVRTQVAKGTAGKPGFRFVFFGGGKRRVEIERFIAEHPDMPVELHDYVPRRLLEAHLRSADIHLASLESSWSGTMLPSKLQGIFAVGRPVLFVGDVKSSTGRWSEESGGGWTVAPGDVEGLCRVIDEAAAPAVRLQKGNAARDYHERHFDRRVNSARLATLFSRPG